MILVNVLNRTLFHLTTNWLFSYSRNVQLTNVQTKMFVSMIHNTVTVDGIAVMDTMNTHAHVSV